MEELGQKPAILSLDPNSLEDVLSDIIRVGQATNAQDVAEGVVAKLRERVDAVKQKAALAGTRFGGEGRERVAAVWLAPRGTGPAGGRLAVLVTEAVSAAAAAGEPR